MKKLTASLLLLCVLLTGCGQKTVHYDAPELLEPVGVNIDTAEITRGDLINLQNYEGSLVPSAESLYFTSGGTIKTLHFYPGQEVKEGDVLMTLDQDDILKQQEDIKKRIEDLKTEGGFSDQLGNLEIAYAQTNLDEYNASENIDPNRQALLRVAVEEAQLRLRQAQESRQIQLDALQKSLDTIESQLSESSVVAPFDGTLFYGTDITEGTYVQPGRTVCYVINPKDVEFTVSSYISESDLEKYHYWALLDGKEWELELIPMDHEEMISMSVSGKTIRRSFHILGTGADSLKAGTYGSLILENLHHEDVLLVPVNATKTDAGGRFVYVIQENGEREKRYFEAGLTNDIYFEVKAGLSEGEVVYVQN